MGTFERRQSVNAGDKKKLEAWLGGLDRFLAIRHTLPGHYMRAFLLVALEEGLGVTEYVKKSGVSQSVMSRHLSDLGDKDRSGGPGYGLLTIRMDPLNLRRHQVMLTDKGRALAGSIIRLMGRV
jgi:DNA-binding MarR family transcriptional regulator